MENGGGIDPPRGGDAVTFTQALDALKTRGSTLLVTGCVPQEMYLHSSSQMLGDGAANPARRRLVVVPEVTEEDVGRIEGSGSTAPEWSRIVVCGEGARSAAATEPGESGVDLGPPAESSTDRPIKQELAGCDVATLGRTVSTVLGEFDRAADGLEPAELRVAFDCLPVLLARYDLETVFRFVHGLSYDVRRYAGMGHVWLPNDRTSDVSRTLGTLFDAVIELEVKEGSLRQRWHFRDVDLTSEWLPVW